MPKPPAFPTSRRFGSRYSRTACWLCLGLCAVFAVSAPILAYLRVENWHYFLLAAFGALYAATQFARGIDPTEKMPRLPP